MSADNLGPEELDVRFRRPDSQVVSVRLNVDESRELTEAARMASQRLSTFMKEAALEVARRHTALRTEVHVGGSTEAGRVVVVSSGASQRFVSGCRATDVTFFDFAGRDATAVS